MHAYPVGQLELEGLPVGQAPQRLLVAHLPGDVHGNAVEAHRLAIAAVVGTAQRPDPPDLAGDRVDGAVAHVVRLAIRDRGLDRLARGLSIVGVQARVELLDVDDRVGRHPEMRLDALVPDQAVERKVAVPEADARKADGVVQPRAIRALRRLGGLARHPHARLLRL